MKNNSIQFDENFIDLPKIFEIILRKKLTVITSTGIIFFLSIIYAFSLKKIWQGQFQIVMSERKLNQFERLNPLGNLTGSAGNKLLTEVEILKSPSVLLPIFNYVVNEKKKLDPEFKLYFNDWRGDALNINLLRGTRILNITYKDSDQKLIINTLNNLSQTYQKYSGEERRKTLDRTVDFLNEQYDILKEKSDESFYKLQAYAVENNLTYQIDVEKNIAIIPIEQTIIKISNEINNLNEQLKELENEEIIVDELLPYFANLNASDGGLIESVKNLERNIENRKLYFRGNDREILKLKKQKFLLIDQVRRELKLALESKIIFLEAQKKASQRDKNVLVIFRGLVNNAFRDLISLEKLKEERQFTLLEQAKTETPWTLITKPTLSDFPIAPRKKTYAFFGLILGFAFGSSIVLLLNKKEGLIFYKEDVSNILEADLLLDLTDKNIKNTSEVINLLFNGKRFNQNYKNLALIPVGEISNNKTDIFRKSILEFVKDRKIDTITNILDADKFDRQILLIYKGKSRKDDLQNILYQLSLNSNKINGWIFLDD